MSLMAVLIEPLLPRKIDPARLLKMIIIHDSPTHHSLLVASAEGEGAVKVYETN
jgi:hypothetical protein